MAAACEGGGPDRRASKRTKVAASALQRPPISRAMTVSRQRFDLHSSGYVRFLARLAVSKAFRVDDDCMHAALSLHV